jgi:hypothetical protein
VSASVSGSPLFEILSHPNWDLRFTAVAPSGFSTESKNMKPKDLGKQIVVVDNGFVHVGDCSISDGLLSIDNCKNIRRYGTQKGLGQLISGPLKETIADEMGTVLVPIARVVFFLGVLKGW